MLHITIRCTQLPWLILMLEGHIVAEWADMLERECLELGRDGIQVVLDLAGVKFIGRSGLEVLDRLGRAGVGIIGCSPLVAEMLEQQGLEVSRATKDPRNGKEDT